MPVPGTRADTRSAEGLLSQVAPVVQRCYSLTGISRLAGVEDYTEGIYHGDPHRDYHDAQARQHAYLLDELQVRPGFRLLEIGCGLGTLMKAATARGAEVTGVTVSADQAAQCRARGLHAELRDYKALPRDWHGHFDGIVVNGALEHFCQPQDALSGRQDAIYRDMFARFGELLDRTAPTPRRVVTTALHFADRPVPPEKFLRSPWLQMEDREGFHFAILHRGYGGYYPTRGQLERCAADQFRLVREQDGTQDYGLTAGDWYRKFRHALRGGFGQALLRAFLRNPRHTFWFAASFVGPASQLWQFRGPSPPVRHYRQTWELLPNGERRV